MSIQIQDIKIAIAEHNAYINALEDVLASYPIHLPEADTEIRMYLAYHVERRDHWKRELERKLEEKSNKNILTKLFRK